MNELLDMLTAIAGFVASFSGATALIALALCEMYE